MALNIVVGLPINMLVMVAMYCLLQGARCPLILLSRVQVEPVRSSGTLLAQMHSCMCKALTQQHMHTEPNGVACCSQYYSPHCERCITSSCMWTPGAQ